MPTMSLLSLPNELLVTIAEELRPKYLVLFLPTNRRLACLLTPLLHKHAIQDYDGLPALHWAAKKRHEPLVRLLLSKGAEVTTKDDLPSFQATALHWAGAGGNEAIVRLLLERGADINALDIDEETPLSYACRHGSKTALRVLLNNGADPSNCGSHKISALLLAIGQRNEAVVRLLLERGANINSRVRSGPLPIHHAVRHSKASMTRLLLEQGADPSGKDGDDGDTPLHVAARSGYWDDCMALVGHGADLLITNRSGRTPLGEAMQRGHHDIVHLLLASCVETNVPQSAYGILGLHYAAKNGCEDVAVMLLKQGVDVNGKCENGMTALVQANNSGQSKVAELLLENGADATIA